MKEKGRKNKKYSPEFKIAVIMDMRENHLGYREVTRKYWGLKTERELRQKYPLKELLKLSKLPRSTYYYYRHHKGEGKYKLEKQEILNLFELNKQRYGYRRITALLRQVCLGKGIV